MKRLIATLSATSLSFTSLLACAPAPAKAQASCSNGICEVPNPSATELAILSREREGAWKAIAWQNSADSALSAAKAAGKPILVVLSVGQRGRADAPDT